MRGWMELFERIGECSACGLRASRTFAVPGEGDPSAALMLIGEGPGAEEDAQGRPFVGASGALLTALLRSVGIEREEVYIANVVKCRPPGNRTPVPEEAAACRAYLDWQIGAVRPQVIVLLGATAAKSVLEQDVRIRRDHGSLIERNGIWHVPTFHPSALLRDPTQKILAYRDFQIARAKLKELTGN